MNSFFAFAVLVLALMSAFILGLQTRKRPHTPGGRQDFNFEVATELGIEPARRATLLPPPEIPESYQDVKLTLLVRDPEWLFAYWEISLSLWEEVQKKYGNIARYENITLRIIELSGGMAYFDLKVGSLLGNWHIYTGKPNASYYAVLGLTSNRGFLPLIMSNAVTTPRNTMSHLGDDEWMLVSEYEQKLIQHMGQIPFDVTSPFMFRKEG